MAEADLLEDPQGSSTPLDLLLNAISGSNEYRYPVEGGENNEGRDGAGEDNAQLSLGGLLEASRASVIIKRLVSL